MISQVIPLHEGREDVTLTSYILDDSLELLAGKTRPAILILPGGGYLNCSAREGESVALRFAAMGYHAFVLRYSTYSHGADAFFPRAADIPPDPSCQFPAPMRDIGKAFLTIRAHAEEWRVDTARIAICGFSAGAHNCAMYCVYWHDPIIYAHLGTEPEALKPFACLFCYGISDYSLMMGNPTDELAQILSKASSIALLGTDQPTEAQLRAVSPALLVNEFTPPMFIWATAADELVPVENSTRMATALASKGVPFEMHIFEEGPHGLSLSDQASASSLWDKNDDAAVWVSLAEVWLKKRLALPLREKPYWMEQLNEAGDA